jgi:dTDP-4-dehydrorhamnose reductase
MIKIGILGSQGMAGSTICSYFSSKNYKVLEINTSGISRCGNDVVKFDVMKSDFSTLRSKLIDLDYLINCAGVIKHKINDEDFKSVELAIKLNSLLPFQITELSAELNFKIIQLATDCIFSGDLGNYDEKSKSTPFDFYGYSKILGEHLHKNLMTLRCSFVGKEINSKLEFLEWVLDPGGDRNKIGYSNHYWNGITTYHLARIIEGVLLNGLFNHGTFHVVPQDAVSKLELGLEILNAFNEKGIKFDSGQSPKYCNRILSTLYPSFNDTLWASAGYEKPLRISEMLVEYAIWARKSL